MKPLVLSENWAYFVTLMLFLKMKIYYLSYIQFTCYFSHEKTSLFLKSQEKCTLLRGKVRDKKFFIPFWTHSNLMVFAGRRIARY